MRILAAGFLYSATVNFSESISTRSKETLVIVLGTDFGGHIQQKQNLAIVLVGGVWMLIMMYGWLSQIQHALEPWRRTLSQRVTPRIIRSKRIVW